MNFEAFFETELDKLKDAGNYRVFADLERHKGGFPKATRYGEDGETSEVTVWCSNDYLGMGQNECIVDAVKQAVDAVGTGSGGTRNISGTTHYHVQLEKELADLHDKDRALLMTSGYVANEATLGVMSKILPGLIIFSDEMNHASMISGISRARCEKQIFKHNDLNDLRKKLEAADPEAHYRLVILPAKVALQHAYLQNATFLTDIRVIVRTLRRIFKG